MEIDYFAGCNGLGHATLCGWVHKWSPNTLPNRRRPNVVDTHGYIHKEINAINILCGSKYYA
jgi:hypothetical protein